MKRGITAILLAALAFGALAACAQNAAGSPGLSPSPAVSPQISDKPSSPEVSPADPEATDSLAGGDEIKTDSGRYVGQIDNNFIEIKISGVPDDIAAKVFMLSADMREDFEALGLETEDDVRFEYYVDADGHNVLVSIKKI